MLASSEGDASQLKVWALQDLGVQAASRVLSAKNPLQTLRDICQNFPFMARSLSKTKGEHYRINPHPTPGSPRTATRRLSLGVLHAAASPQLEDEIANLQSSSWGPGYSGAFLNGRPLPVQQNDLFSLLQTMQRELQTVDALSSLGLPSATIRSLVSLPAPTAALRINASHPSVVMLNDVGKDRKCSPPAPDTSSRPTRARHVMCLRSPWCECAKGRRTVRPLSSLPSASGMRSGRLPSRSFCGQVCSARYPSAVRMSIHSSSSWTLGRSLGSLCSPT